MSIDCSYAAARLGGALNAELIGHILAEPMASARSTVFLPAVDPYTKHTTS